MNSQVCPSPFVACPNGMQLPARNQTQNYVANYHRCLYNSSIALRKYRLEQLIRVCDSWAHRSIPYASEFGILSHRFRRYLHDIEESDYSSDEGN